MSWIMLYYSGKGEYKMKRKYNRLLCIILSVFLLLSALPLTVYAATDTYSVSTPQELRNAVTEINGAGAGEYTISLAADIYSEIGGIDIGSIERDYTGTVVTIIGNGHSLTCSSGQNVQAWNGAKVILGDGETELTLIGDMSGVNNSYPGIVYIFGAKSVGIMNDKVTLKDNMTNNYFGAGVSIESGTFIMNGGTIDNCGVDGGSVCYGGGVAVYNGGSFTMEDGTINGCYVKSDYIDDFDPNRCFTAQGGGVFVTAGSTFTMNGGTISNCEATNFGGGVSVDVSYNEITGGFGYFKSKVTINGGTISGNTAGDGAGIFASGFFYAYANAFSWNPSATGNPSNPGVYINGGLIKNNNADGMGGGIFAVGMRTPTKIHNAEISSNCADSGAGIAAYYYWVNPEIDGCTISDNTADSNGGGIALLNNIVGTYLKNTTITDNTSGARGAGVYYNNNSKLTISGANIIQNNTYNGKQNNLNVLSLSKPVYVNGDLTGSQIGLSDPTLWDDDLEDIDPEAVSANYLTSGYKANNAADPGTVFTSDHETWIADFSDVDTNEVRLVRKTTVDYHINNQTIADAKYQGEDIFTSYVAESTGEIKIGDTINAFYTVPEVTPTAQNSCPYIFKGWYYDKANNNDTRPVKFGMDTYIAGRDIYAHWIEVKNVAKDMGDEYSLPEGETEYGGFDLTGVQVRNRIIDTNFNNELKPGGLRFMTSLSMDVVNQINAIKPNNIEYGYVAATREDWINAHQQKGDKLQYVSATANGKNTTDIKKPGDYFGFAKNVVCTSKKTNTGDFVNEDHRNFKDYLLYTLVITYEDGKGMDKNVLARPYIRYRDANDLDRVAYSEYRGISNTLGGCYTSYKAILPAP